MNKGDRRKERKQIMESKTGGINEQRIFCTEANPGPIPSSLMLRPRQIPKLKFRERFKNDDFKMVYRYLSTCPYQWWLSLGFDTN